ncbi:D-alanyl-D-alanine carboxypeptidase family protein [Sinorhizobium meliloti]|uniref:D-alanyl-D-alanine carboxypeptidase family protein n=1 Tax=Rhizobium meliloti TaxID=382 RepID=UPI000FD89A14|nr:D-alanyl-D-alanine carboxypeptidase family protein [Sinorhizobium meliloti]RVG95999.1 phage tail protein [Sinorhizobium meliloti]WQP07809.1 D-alanyl-D-alanine carboxypeptidase family protein [Sinorhizobium meliloti]WQP21214.1 D-alanyl-D-alanine carboxypeptidase family protein [Sinorhizobium meliloti]WQP34629.1 D-alanyl-D-alanine carboxypeptidase family protein [Sinorhizobium meliloti]
MSDDLLLVTFRANADKYQRDVDRARTYGGKRFRQMQQDAEKAGSGIEKAMGGAMKTLGSFGKGVLGGAVGALAVGGFGQIIASGRDVVRTYAMISNEAKRAGLSAKAFQELSYVAEQNRIEVDALIDGMKELNLRADEWIVTGAGPAAEAFQRLGYSAQDLKRKLADPSALLIEIIGRLEHLDRAAQIRIADELFGGTGGERFVELLDRGAEGIRRTIKEANALGIILDDDVIKRADEIDRKFNKISGTVGTALKKAVVDVIGAMDDWLDRMNRLEEQTDRNIQSQLLSTYDKLRDAKALLSDLELDKAAFPNDPAVDLNIDKQKRLIEELTGEAMKLRDILDRRNGYDENFIYGAGEDAKGAKPPLDNLNNALSGTGSAAKDALKGINSYADAIRALKEEVPELAASLRDLDAKSRIDAVYRQALARAQGQREIALANQMRGKALQGLGIKSATDDPASYLSNVLASGKSKDHVNGMADAFASKLAKMLASMPDDLKGSVTINSGYRSIERQQQLWLDALKKYGSPEAARKWVAPPGNSQHNHGNAADLGYSSGRARQWMHANAGNFGLSFPLANENWHIEDADARNKQVSAEIEKLTQAATQQADAYSQITASAREYTAAQGTERQALGMTAQQAQALRYEQEMLNEAQRAGIALTPQQRQEIANLAQGMAAAEGSVEGLRLKQDEARETARFFGQSMTDALTGIISGTMSAEEALQQLLQTMLKATLQALLMGEGPLANMFGGGKKGDKEGGVGFGGLFGSLLGGLFGFAEGGWTGPGGKYEPAGVVHRGEYVMSKKATNRIGVGNLEALHRGALGGFAEGGFVGNAPAIRKPDLKPANGNSVQAISISAPITVNGSAGTEAQNTDLAQKMAKQMETTVRGVIADEMRRQTRPGNFMNSRSR